MQHRASRDTMIELSTVSETTPSLGGGGRQHNNINDNNLNNINLNNNNNNKNMNNPTAKMKKTMKKMKHKNGNIDLAFPSVIINTSSLKEKRKRKNRSLFRFMIVLLLCLVLLFHFIDRTILRLPPAEIRLDFSNVKAITELSVDPIEQWCFVDEHDSCPCSNPLIPEGRQEDPRWETVHHLNKDAIRTIDMDNLDVIFLGDSITEGWSGNYYSRPDPRAEGALPIFQSYFSKRHGGKYEALPQGISGDVSPNLLWRIQNGEIGTVEEDLHERQLTSPLIFWLLIGTNDIGRTNCSPDMVILGIIRIVEELRMQKPSAIVVINGLLPRTHDDHSGFLMQSQGKLPILWPLIKTINTELRRYAEKREKVEYFETMVFLQNHTAPDAELRIDQNLMKDCLHPSAEGYKLWGAEIVAKLETLIKPLPEN